MRVVSFTDAEIEEEVLHDITRLQLVAAYELWLSDFRLNPETFYSDEDWDAGSLPTAAEELADYLLKLVKVLK